MSQDPIVIVGAARTPMGGLQGELSQLNAAELGAFAIQAAIERAGADAAMIEEVIMGNVLSAGQGQAPARQAALGAQLPLSTTCTTINKMCGSGMKAAMLAHDLLLADSAQVMIAGGMESMTNAPYLLNKARGGYRLGHGEIKDHMFLDGLEDAYDKGRAMGVFAQCTADDYSFSREAQDAFALASLQRAKDAEAQGHFAKEICSVSIKNRKGTVEVSCDEQPRKAMPEKIPQLRPVFRADGTVTAANSSSISDGAAALLMMRESQAQQRGLQPIARILGHASHAQEPALFTTAPVAAIRKLLSKTGWQTSDVDLWEINEAFAIVTMAAMHDLELPHAAVNVHGGACALGHPIGASGARIIVSLLNALKIHGKKRGVAALCIGGGEATAMAFELA
ncbi:MAG: acetyl-CoA C-acyltransferase [Oceanococcus sp.]